MRAPYTLSHTGGAGGPGVARRFTAVFTGSGRLLVLSFCLGWEPTTATVF